MVDFFNDFKNQAQSTIQKNMWGNIYLDTPTYCSVQVLASTHVVDEISDLRQRAAKGLGKGQA